ncbi:MAG TPA: glycerol-3-phosphate acyltransferase [Geoalkalibacter subterraneus]|uniref:Glycerol-3-phosphate acyltransferase n=1 Tax=Geoalkalibacter subterraneus TaxID=483547 RepID=A0A831LMA8_9BACT|nr:glycerol-3-phosphate acyltransferase [Geoalkalibacter subterraneus]
MLVLLILSYLVGAIPCGMLLTKLAGLGDIRSAGSGNIGATNVYRVGGRCLGVFTLILDALKGVLPVFVALQVGFSPVEVALIASATFLGHCYPVYLGFKGGKGVATGLGIYLVLSPLAVSIALLVFGAVLWRWRYVSLASISAAAVIPFLVLGIEGSIPLFLATLFIAAMVIFRHRGNIERLLDGSENRFQA